MEVREVQQVWDFAADERMRGYQGRSSKVSVLSLSGQEQSREEGEEKEQRGEEEREGEGEKRPVRLTYDSQTHTLALT